MVKQLSSRFPWMALGFETREVSNTAGYRFGAYPVRSNVYNAGFIRFTSQALAFRRG
jgi:hypothetical protein